MTKPTPLPPFPARDLLLGIEAFPPEWTFNPCTDNCARREGTNQAERTYFLPHVSGPVILEIIYFAQSEDAARTYTTYRTTEFRERVPPNSQFTPPVEVSFRGDFADEQYFGCGIDEIPGCTAIFRYGNYVIYLYSVWDNGDGYGLKLPEIVRLMKALDALVVSRLK